MCRSSWKLLSLAVAVSVLGGCGGSAMVRYGDGTKAKAGEHTFAIPRTVVRIEYEIPRAPAAGGAREAAAPAAPKEASLSFTPVPLVTDAQGANLPVFSITDDSSSGFAWVPTTVTSVIYADHLVIQSIGTAITDNRKAIIEAAFGIFGTVAKAVGFMSERQVDCSAGIEKFKPFVLADFKETGPQTQRIANNPCWGYQLVEAKDMGDTSAGAFSLAGDDRIPFDAKVGWFPYPACKNYRIAVVKCPTATGVCSPVDGAQAYRSVVAVSDGTAYRKKAFPPKGKISMHANFCVADVTSDPSPLATNWDIVNQVISNTKALIQPASGSAPKK